MKSLKELLLKLNITDLIVIIFYTILIILNIVFCCRIEQWPILIVMNVGIIAAVFGIAYLDHPGDNRLWYNLHYWYLVPLILLTFKELYLMIKPIRINDYDYLLIAADRFMFGTDPTRVLDKIANPLLTEILQISYGTFYFLPILLGIDLMVRKRLSQLDFGLFAVVYGFFLSYLGYFMLPAIGPRFTLHDFYSINTDLPGLCLTNFLREVVNTGESIPSGTPNPAAVVQRDVFPSGHTQMTLITMYLTCRYNSKMKYVIVPVGTLLIFATVYLRYHYVIDLIGGTLFMIFTMWSGKKIYNWWQSVRSLPEFNYDNTY
ncbi:MAG: phosphatase PAP2 family protein [Bacteroidota bacterium]